MPTRRDLFKTTAAAALAAQVARPQSSQKLQGRELFVDNYWIDKVTNATLRLATPLDGGTSIKFDKPWEGAFSGYSTIVDMGDRRYRLYYRGIPKSGADGRMEEVTCYAESKDGIEFTRPDYNVFLKEQPPFSHNFSPFIDKRPGVAESERWKAIAGTGASGLVPFVSADGLKWRKLRNEPVVTTKNSSARFDSQNLAFWSVSEQRYVMYLRSFRELPDKRRIRWVSRSTSEDFLTWTHPVEMEFVRANGQPAPPEHLYTNQTSPYFRAPHIYIAISARFQPGRQVLTPEEAKAINVDPDYFKDCSDAIMMSTRGGNTYQRTFLEGFLRPGVGMENWVSRTNYPALNVIQTGPAEISFYANKNYGQPTTHLQRYTLRLDGFASLHAPYDGGEMVTKPFVLAGSKLDLNYSTSAAGSVRVEVQDASGGALAGFALADCREIIGDQVTRQVNWSSAELGSQRGKTVRLRFVLRDADLYSWAVV